MTIDKNNWFIREGSLTEEQYVDVCKYLVENYEGDTGKFRNLTKIMDVSKGAYLRDYSEWDFIGVVDEGYTSVDSWVYKPNTVITYQQFLEHIKGVSEESDSTPSQSLQELTDNYVKAVRELTGSTTTSYNLFINCEGVTVTENKRTSEDLKASGCSMRNLKGEFIK